MLRTNDLRTAIIIEAKGEVFFIQVNNYESYKLKANLKHIETTACDSIHYNPEHWRMNKQCKWQLILY